MVETHGVLAHLVERFHGMEEVRSSNLLHSTIYGLEAVRLFFVSRVRKLSVFFASARGEIPELFLEGVGAESEVGVEVGDFVFELLGGIVASGVGVDAGADEGGGSVEVLGGGAREKVVVEGGLDSGVVGFEVSGVVGDECPERARRWFGGDSGRVNWPSEEGVVGLGVGAETVDFESAVVVPWNHREFAVCETEVVVLSEGAEVAVAIGSEGGGGEEADDRADIPVVGGVVERVARERFDAGDDEGDIGLGVFSGGVEEDGIVAGGIVATVDEVATAVGIEGGAGVGVWVERRGVGEEFTIGVDAVPVDVIGDGVEEGGGRVVGGAGEEGLVDGFDGEEETFVFAVDVEFGEGGEGDVGAGLGHEAEGKVGAEVARLEVEATED